MKFSGKIEPSSCVGSSKIVKVLVYSLLSNACSKDQVRPAGYSTLSVEAATTGLLLLVTAWSHCGALDFLLGRAAGSFEASFFGCI